MNEVEIYNRSVNLYKITDGTYKDRYVDIYKYLIDLFNHFKLFESEKYPDIQFFGKSEEDIYGQLNNDYNICSFDVEKFEYFNMDKNFAILKKYISEFFIHDYKYIIPNDKKSRFYMNPFIPTKRYGEILYIFGDWELKGVFI